MAPDAVADELLCRLAELPELLCPCGTEARHERGRAHAVAGIDLPAIAPRGAPADALGLEQRHLVAALGQLQSGREAGEAAADDGDVDGKAARQRRALGPLVGGRGIIGGDMIARHAVPAFDRNDAGSRGAEASGRRAETPPAPPISRPRGSRQVGAIKRFKGFLIKMNKKSFSLH